MKTTIHGGFALAAIALSAVGGGCDSTEALGPFGPGGQSGFSYEGAWSGSCSGEGVSGTFTFHDDGSGGSYDGPSTGALAGSIQSGITFTNGNGSQCQWSGAPAAATIEGTWSCTDGCAGTYNGSRIGGGGGDADAGDERDTGGGERDTGGGERDTGGGAGSVDLRGAPDVFRPFFSAPRGLGWPCSTDADCDSGLCIRHGDSDPDYRYCTQSCSSNDDCDPMFANSIVFEVPIEFETFSGLRRNNWNSEYLTQAVFCGNDEAAGDVCLFVCPVFSAVVWDDEGQPAACSCLPGFTRDEAGPGQHCYWDTELGCSTINDSDGNPLHVCDESTAMGGPGEGCPEASRPACMWYDNATFEGACVWWPESITACVGESEADCDEECYVQCMDAATPEFSDNCLNLCCD